MDSDYTIYVVDDDHTTRLLLQSALADRYAVETFDCAEAGLERMEQKLPSLFLLDVGLPGLNGYEACRQIKASEAARRIPVVFVSGHDSIDEVLAGYDAGGEDYIVKPVDVLELHRKIENLRRIEEDRRSLLEQAKASDELATLVLANLDEYAILIKFLRTLNECGEVREIADAMLHVLGAYHLEGAVQIRMRNLEKTVSKAGENWPLEIAVINHVRSLERIFEFKRRAVYNFEHLTVLITNMPIEDSELCGRIRDNVAIAAESADAKLAALQSFEDKAKMRDEIHSLLQALEQNVESYSHEYDQARYKSSMFTTRLLDELMVAFARLGMSAQQEEEILAMVKERAYQLVDLYDFGSDTQTTLTGLSKRLAGILAATETAVRA